MKHTATHIEPLNQWPVATLTPYSEDASMIYKQYYDCSQTVNVICVPVFFFLLKLTPFAVFQV